MTFKEWWKNTGYGWEDARGHQTSPSEIAEKAWKAGFKEAERIQKLREKYGSSK